MYENNIYYIPRVCKELESLSNELISHREPSTLPLSPLLKSMKALRRHINNESEFSTSRVSIPNTLIMGESQHNEHTEHTEHNEYNEYNEHNEHNEDNEDIEDIIIDNKTPKSPKNKIMNVEEREDVNEGNLGCNIRNTGEHIKDDINTGNKTPTIIRTINMSIPPPPSILLMRRANHYFQGNHNNSSVSEEEKKYVKYPWIKVNIQDIPGSTAKNIFQLSTHLHKGDTYISLGEQLLLPHFGLKEGDSNKENHGHSTLIGNGGSIIHNSHTNKKNRKNILSTHRSLAICKYIYIYI